MRGVLYAMIISGLFFVPLRRVNIADLLPVQALSVQWSGSSYILETDLGQKGSGETIKAAIQNLKRNSTGVIYLDTIEYLFITDGTENVVREMRKHLKGSTQVYVGNGKENIADVAQYLSVHAKLPKLRNWGE